MMNRLLKKLSLLMVILASTIFLNSFLKSENKSCIETRKSSISKLLEANGFIVLDSIVANANENYLFEQIREETQIDLISEITKKYYLKVSENRNSKAYCLIAVYEYSNNRIACETKENIDSFFKLNPTQINPILYDIIHKTDEVYYCFNNYIIACENKGLPCIKAKRIFDEMR